MTMLQPSGTLAPAAGGLIEIINHLHQLRLTATIEVETSGGVARLQVVEGTVRAAVYRDRAGMTAITAASLLATGPFRLTPPQALMGDQIGLLTPALLDLLRETTARVRTDYATKGRQLPMDPLMGAPIPDAETTTDELLAEAKLVVRGRSEEAEPPADAAGEFPEDFLGGLVPEGLRGDAGGEDLPPAKPTWIPPGVGQVLGKCYLTAQVGVGSSAIVYRALHMSLKIDVAVKVLTPDQDQRSRRINLREAQVLARLNHQNILRVLDCSDSEPYPHLVMEYVDGQTLAAMIQQAGRLQAATAVGIILQATEGLAYAASEGVTHNDVKPGNLLVSRTQVVKVADLGVARAAFHDKGDESARAVVGTPAYISPELVAGGIGNSSPASDVYSLGCTFFHAVTGRLPFTDLDPIRMMLQHVQEQPPEPRSLVPDLDERIDLLIQRMLAKQAADRPSYDELLAELHRLRATFVEAGAIAPGMVRNDVPSAIMATLSSAWRTVRAALDKVLRPGGESGSRRMASVGDRSSTRATQDATPPPRPKSGPVPAAGKHKSPPPGQAVARDKAAGEAGEKPRSRRVIKP